ncbi:MAG: bifunctional 4-hydroxy-2-oxoglutarate aldolase/2-dehydro-3-deoxy-phosphogluconate aldolase [Hyphomonadaceae bacterium]
MTSVDRAKASEFSGRLDDIMARQPVLPVLTVPSADKAVRLAEVLLAAGLPVMEVTLRTPDALESIRRMRAVQGAIVGAGTILNAADAEAAIAAGAEFVVTPGLSVATVSACVAHDVPVLPGVATASEIMSGLEMGLERFKFFPAEHAGGRHMLAALHGPFPSVRFCPTGSITLDLSPGYLATANVAMVGGGWVAPKRLIEVEAWEEIAWNADKAAKLKRG